MECDVCKKDKEDVRFEGSFEGNICDGCLAKMKREELIKVGKDELIQYLLDFYNNNSLTDEAEDLVLSFLEEKLNVDIRTI